MQRSIMNSQCSEYHRSRWACRCTTSRNSSKHSRRSRGSGCSRSPCREKNPSKGHLILQVLYTLEVQKTREQHHECVEKETKSRQSSSSWPNTESPERQHIDKVMCQLCYTGRFQQSKPSKKKRGSYQAAFHRQSCRQLCEHAEVSADGAENRRRCTSTAERQNRSSSPRSVPCRKLRKGHIQSLTGIPDILMHDARGTENCGSSQKE